MAQFTIEQALQIALQHHTAGQLPQAEQLYRQILAQNPKHAEALQLLGVLAHQVGRNDVAVDLIRQAIALRPNWPEAYGNLGEVLRVLGRLDEAIAACRMAISLKPNNAEAHYNLGIALKDKGLTDQAVASYRTAITLRPNYHEAHSNLGSILKDKGQLDQAIAAYRRAIAVKPDYSQAHSNLGTVLQEKGQLDQAIACYRQAIAFNPKYPEAYNNLGNALQENKQSDEAIAAYRQAIAVRPDYPEAHSNLGNVLQDKGQLDQAIAAYRQAISLKPNYPEAHSNLGNALQDRGQLDEAIAGFRQAIALNPNYTDAYLNLGVAMQAKGQLDEAIAAFRRAIALKSDLALARWNLALTLLERGDFKEGWDEYEWRWGCKNFAILVRNFPQPLWDGRPLAGRTILLHAEQGFGDTIQFIRYLPMVQQWGGRIVIECRPELQRLLQAMAANYPVVAQGQPLPAFDVHCPLMSLPRVFGTNLENIPSQMPYLHADPAMVQQWRQRLAGDSHSLKVGLAWAGRPTHKNDRKRSVALAALAPLGRSPGVSFYSLQKGEQADQLKNPAAGLELIDWTDDVKDFADTAALVANLDLVISVDTALVHLAGAMGKPVWVLVPFAPDWRWLIGREDSPWYPTMRLFRQPAIGDWQSVIQRVAAGLMELAGATG